MQQQHEDSVDPKPDTYIQGLPNESQQSRCTSSPNTWTFAFGLRVIPHAWGFLISLCFLCPIYIIIKMYTTKSEEHEASLSFILA